MCQRKYNKRNKKKIGNTSVDFSFLNIFLYFNQTNFTKRLFLLLTRSTYNKTAKDQIKRRNTIV